MNLSKLDCCPKCKGEVTEVIEGFPLLFCIKCGWHTPSTVLQSDEKAKELYEGIVNMGLMFLSFGEVMKGVDQVMKENPELWHEA
jgi:malate synthase